MIPFISFGYKKKQMSDKIIRAIKGIIDSEEYVLGNNILSFESGFAKLIDSKYCIGVGNGLDALIISLKSLGISEGDEVIVPANTYIASWLAVSATGAKVVPVEPDIKTYNIDPDLIDKKITSKTKAIMPVHLYGQSCNMTKIMKIAKDNSLFVVEDNAQGHLSKWKNRFTGTFGDINATSFYPTKNIGAIGEAGAITTSSLKLSDFAKKYRNYGSAIQYHNEIKGINSRIDEIQAAILDVKLQYIDEMTNERINNAHIYNELLSNTDITLPFTEKNAEHVYHLYVVRHKRRNELQKFLAVKGIQTSIHYPIVPQDQNAYSNEFFDNNPLSKEIAETCLSLPIYPGLKREQIDFICRNIIEFCKNDK